MSSMKIHGSEYGIDKVFSNDFAFEIPHYQRPYAWTTEHAGELLDDLLAAMNETKTSDIENIQPYFLGCVVLIKEEDRPEAKVVDGQQRLTTITILLSVLRETIIEDAKAADALTQFLYDEGNAILETPNRYRLSMRESDNPFLKEFIQERGGLTKLLSADGVGLSSISQKNIFGNAKLYHEKLKELPESQRKRLAMFLLRRCVLVVVSSPNLDSAYRIFSILNDRGLDLSHADILKAEIVGKLQDSRSEEYSKKWEDAENELGAEEFKDLFAHIRMVYRKQKLRETVLKEFRDYVIPEHLPEELVDDIVLPYSQSYLEITTATFESATRAEEINAILRWLNLIDNSDWIPPSIKHLTDHRNDPAAIVRFFLDLERLAAMMMITRVGITKRIERYGKLLKAMSEGEDLYADDSPLQLSEEECKQTMNRLGGPVYIERSVPRFALLRLDSLMSEGEATYNYPIISVEHVLPQNPADGSEWDSTFLDEEEREQLTHCIGNLVLLSRRKNSSASNYDFETKKSKYFTKDGTSSSFVLTSQVISENSWTPEVIKRRQTELLKMLKDEWRL